MTRKTDLGCSTSTLPHYLQANKEKIREKITEMLKRCKMVERIDSCDQLVAAADSGSRLGK